MVRGEILGVGAYEGLKKAESGGTITLRSMMKKASLFSPLSLHILFFMSLPSMIQFTATMVTQVLSQVAFQKLKKYNFK